MNEVRNGRIGRTDALRANNAKGDPQEGRNPLARRVFKPEMEDYVRRVETMRADELEREMRLFARRCMELQSLCSRLPEAARKRPTAYERMIKKAVRDPETLCLVFQGALFAYGYGKVRLGAIHGFRCTTAHRISWEHHRGEIPQGHHVHHRCENRACVNIDHLELLTAGDHARIHAKQRTQSR